MADLHMAKVTTPYLDLTVLPELRPHMIAGHAAVVFTPEIDGVLWTNGEGAALIGANNVRNALDGTFSMPGAMRRQVESAADVLVHKSTASALMRVPNGFKTRLLKFSITEIMLPNEGRALLLISEALHGRRHREQDMALAAVTSLDGLSHAAAVLDENGVVIAASSGFSAVEVSDQELFTLVHEVADEDDRLVKRPIATAHGEMPAGIARLSDQPQRNILIIAGSLTEGEDAGDHNLSDDQLAHEDNEDVAQEAVVNPIKRFSNKRGNNLRRWYFKPLRLDDEDDEFDGLDAKEERSNEELTGNNDKVEDHPVPVVSEDNKSKAEDATSTGVEAQEVETSANDSDAVEQSATKDDEPSIEDPVQHNETEAEHTPVEIRPVRFVWDMDAEGVFRSVSKELAAAVGFGPSDIVGRSWKECDDRFALNDNGEIDSLLKKGDTWSGKTVMWPIEGTNLKVPVDLAGLPSYGRNRNFEGFNGFGIIRVSDSVHDSADTNEHSGDGEYFEPGDDYDFAAPIGFIPDPSGEQKKSVLLDHDNEAALPRMSELQSETGSERTLSSDEQETFEEIAETLTGTDERSEQDGEKSSSDKARSKDTTKSVSKKASSSTRNPAAKAPTKKTKSTRAEKPIVTIKRRSDDHPVVVGGPDKLVVTKPAEKKKLSEPVRETNSDEHGPLHPDVDTSILERLPIPVLVYRDSDLLFGNKEFFNLTGYGDLKRLAAAGGIEALFGDHDIAVEAGSLNIYHLDGTRIDAQPHLQRVPWDADKALLLTLRRNDGGLDSPSPKERFSKDDGKSSKNRSSKRDEQVKGDGPRLASVTSLQAVKETKKNEKTNAQSQTTASTGVNSDRAASFSGLGADDLRSIVDTATDGVIILGDDGIVRGINRSAEALFDVAPETITGESITTLLAPESHRSALDYISGVSGTGVASLLNDGREIIGRTAKGGLIPLFMTIGKLQKTDACCAVVRDITQWKKTEEELLTARSQAEAASRQKSDFLATISHEIRTPLNAIMGFSDLMIEERFGAIDNDRYRGYLRDINRSGEHVLELINDLLDISKIEAGKMDLEFDACDLNTTVSQTVALIQPEANKERIIIRSSLSAVVPKVVADPRSLRQIILNLVSNSIKFTRPGGQVIVSTVYEDTGAVVLRIRDTGVGMSELELEHAMRPFQQVESANTDRSKGTGLGLPLTKAMVEANRAQFHIESKPEEGTLVEVYFPTQRVLAE